MDALALPTVKAAQLLERAAALYDDPRLPLARAARSAWGGGFDSGAEWMRLSLGILRGAPPVGTTAFGALGVLKYALCLTPAVAVLAWSWVAWPLAVALFYLVEVQMVFLFPVALDGRRDLFRSSRALMWRAGGTVYAMVQVMQIAFTMVVGPLLGRDPIRCWSLGCLAVLVWYDHVVAHD